MSRQNKSNIFSSWELSSCMSEKDIRNAILDATSGKLVLPKSRVILPIIDSGSLLRILAAKQIERKIEIVCRKNPDIPAKKIEKLADEILSGFHHNIFYKDRAPKKMHEIIGEMFEEGEIRVGLTANISDIWKWCIVSANIAYDLPDRTILPQNPMWDDRILEIMRAYRPKYHPREVPSPRELSEILSKKLGLKSEITRLELVWLIDRLMRQKKLYLETRVLCHWQDEFTVRVRKAQAKKRR